MIPGGEDLSGKVPVIYSLFQKALTKLPPSGILSRARNTVIQVTWVGIVELAIDEYYGNEATTDINSFSGGVKFEYYIQRAIDTTVRGNLIKHGRWIPQQDREILPSKRTAEEQKLHEIRKRKYTEEELLEKMRELRSRV